MRRDSYFKVYFRKYTRKAILQLNNLYIVFLYYIFKSKLYSII